MSMNLSYTSLAATLVLLLAVSSAIVIRSLVLRRRHRRIVDEAIRTGTWPPQRFESTTGRRRRDIGQKPKLLEAWLHANDDEDDEKRKWVGIMVGSSMLYETCALIVLYLFPLSACLCRICEPAHAITSGTRYRFHGEFRRSFITALTIHTTLYKETVATTATATAYYCVADG